MKIKRILSIFLSVFILISYMPVFADSGALSEDIVILYTNDVHTYIDGPISYDVVASVKKDLEKQYKYVILADAGDHIQGTSYGSMDKGESIIKLMNAAKYDIATLGNHEFDYDFSGCMNIIELAEFSYVSANFYHEENGVRGENVLDDYVLFDCGKEKLAIIGITTPETFTKSTPAYFQDEEGNFIYGISGGENGEKLQEDVQRAIDEAKAQGATQIVALGHLGIDSSSKPWTSEETIAGVCGLDAFIDGHSHSIVERKVVRDKNGHDVILTQTGEYFNRIGMMVIDSETGDITTDFIECEEIIAEDGEATGEYKLASEIYSGKELTYDDETKKIKDEWVKQIDESLGQKIGCATVVFDNYDEEGNRLVRARETNSGDFAADALYYLFDNMGINVDVAIMNGGGVRNTATTGDFTYKTCKDMHTFGNVACLQKVTGEQILDALEWGSKNVGGGENGSFLHVAGLTYKIDTSFDSTVKEDKHEIWSGKPEKYRVYDVKIYNKETNSYEDIVLSDTYHLAGYNYTLRDLGGGFAMFENADNVQDYVMEDYMVLANYIQGFENGIIGATNSPLAEKYPGFLIDYGNVYGSGRIEIADGVKDSFDDVNTFDWFYNDVEYVASNKLMNGIAKSVFAPNDSLTRAMLVTILYRAEGEPKNAVASPEFVSLARFEDVSENAYYADAVRWAQLNDIVKGYSAVEFAPDKNITREQIATIMHRYAAYKKYDVSAGENTNILSYDDFNSISEYAIPAMQYAAGSGLMKGKTETTLNPVDSTTRAEIAAILHRFIEFN